MATKNNPGKFDCYDKAEPDEPMFVLLGRDKHAPALVWLWAALRGMDKESPEKLEEAMNCAAEMIHWQISHDRKPVGLGQSVLAGVLELMRAANYASPLAKADPSDIVALRAFFTTTEFEKPKTRQDAAKE